MAVLISCTSYEVLTLQHVAKWKRRISGQHSRHLIQAMEVKTREGRKKVQRELVSKVLPRRHGHCRQRKLSERRPEQISVAFRSPRVVLAKKPNVTRRSME